MRRKTHRRPRSRTHHPTAQRGPIWLYGVHAALAALTNPARSRHRLLATREGLAAVEAGLADLPAEAQQAAGDVPSEVVPRDRIEALLPAGAVHQGLALETLPLAATSIEEITAIAAIRARASIVVLDRVSDPQNLGAVLRSASAFGAVGLVIPDRHSPAESGAVAKAASGALETVPLVRAANLARALDGLKQAGFWCVGLDSAAEQSLGAAELPDKAALVLGAEDTGLRRLTREHCDLLLRIPIGSAMESLNLSNAAAIALYEFARRGA